MNDPQTPLATVILICADLMTSSRIELQRADGIRTMRSIETALAAAGADTVLLLDLNGFPDGAEQIRSTHGFRGTLIAFAPHVRVDLIEQARPYCTKVVARGAVMQRLDQVIA